MSKTYKKMIKTNPDFKPLVYICAPYKGDTESNKKKAISYADYAYKNGAIPVTVHFLFPFLDDRNEKERRDALFMGIILLGKCDEVWVFGNEITYGMKKELEIAEKRKQPIRYVSIKDLEV